MNFETLVVERSKLSSKSPFFQSKFGEGFGIFEIEGGSLEFGFYKAGLFCYNTLLRSLTHVVVIFFSVASVAGSLRFECGEFLKTSGGLLDLTVFTELVGLVKKLSLALARPVDSGLDFGLLRSEFGREFLTFEFGIETHFYDGI